MRTSLGRITAPAATGPASGPRPTSSTPAIRSAPSPQMVRSARKDGRFSIAFAADASSELKGVSRNRAGLLTFDSRIQAEYLVSDLATGGTDADRANRDVERAHR